MPSSTSLRLVPEPEPRPAGSTEHILEDAAEEARWVHQLLVSLTESVTEDATLWAVMGAPTDRPPLGSRLAELGERVARMRRLAAEAEDDIPAAVLVRLREVSSRLLEAHWLVRQATLRARKAAGAIQSLERERVEIEGAAALLRTLGSETVMLRG